MQKLILLLVKDLVLLNSLFPIPEVVMVMDKNLLFLLVEQLVFQLIQVKHLKSSMLSLKRPLVMNLLDGLLVNFKLQIMSNDILTEVQLISP